MLNSEEFMKKTGDRDKSHLVLSTETSLGSSSSGLVPQRPAPPPPPKLPDIQDQEEYYSLPPHGKTSTLLSLFRLVAVLVQKCRPSS